MRYLFLLISLSVLLLPTLIVHAEVIHVPDTGMQQALDTAAANGEDDTIQIAAGTYPVSDTFTYGPAENKSLTIIGAGKTETILDGQEQRRILEINTMGLADDSNAHITLQNVGLRRGDSGAGAGAVHIQTESADITLQNLRFETNTGTSGGGAWFYTDAGKVLISECYFVGNSAEWVGGGLAGSSKFGDITLKTNTFSGNSTAVGAGTRKGGGCSVSTDYGNLNLESNLFVNNSAGEDAGGASAGAFYAGSSATLMNNIFRNNSARFGAAAIVFTEFGKATVTNNTCHGNDGNWVLLVELWENNASASVYNNISWGNTDAVADIYLHDDKDTDGVGASIEFHYNVFATMEVEIGDNLEESNNIDQNPLLTADSHLQTDSPCIDAGLCGEWVPFSGTLYVYLRIAPLTDIDGDSRCPGNQTTGCCDIGADEFQREFPWEMFLPAILQKK